jgi:septum formation protein
MILSTRLLSALLFGGLHVSAFSCHPRFHSYSSTGDSPSSCSVFARQRSYSNLQMTNTVESTTTTKSPSLLIAWRQKLGDSDDSLAQLVLASQSPRRREILDMMGLAGQYTVEPSPLDESVLQAELIQEQVPAIEYTRRLAEAKAQAVAKKYVDNEQQQKLPTYYLGSDTIVEIDECILEKPKDPSEAKQMLRRLSGRQHHVHTGVAMYRVHQSQLSLISSFTETASVTFSNLNDNDIDAYVASGEPMDKAGTSCCMM